MVLWIKIELTDKYISLIFKFKQYKNANIADFLENGKTYVGHHCIAESWSDRPIWTHPVAVAIPDVLRSTDTALMFALGTDYNEGE